MSFWIKISLIGVILVGLAIAFLLNQDAFMELSESSGVADTVVVAPAGESSADAQSDLAEPATTSEKNKGPVGKSKNAAAEGLSNFYAQLNPDLEDSGPIIRNNVVYLPDPSGDLVKTLEARRMVTRPLRKNWQSVKKSHPFRTGETILQKLTEYTKDEGLSLIWWLNRDFLVKSPFRVNKTITSTAFQLAKSVEGHFQHGINVFFCYQQRTIVIIDEAIPYLHEECLLVEK